jgi:hypothetical protein
MIKVLVNSILVSSIFVGSLLTFIIPNGKNKSCKVAIKTLKHLKIISNASSSISIKTLIKLVITTVKINFITESLIIEDFYFVTSEKNFAFQKISNMRLYQIWLQRIVINTLDNINILKIYLQYIFILFHLILVCIQYLILMFSNHCIF